MVFFFLIVFIFLIFYAAYHAEDNQFYPTNSSLPKFRLTPELRRQLELGFPFYNALSQTNKVTFEKRVKKFIDMKTFEPRGVKEIHDKAKVLIAGCAVQLAYGHPDVYFSHFTTIIVYKSKYRSPATGQLHYGETNINGAIVLSWDKFIHGIKDPNDGIHLGLHEMAHAMKLENLIENGEHGFFLPPIRKRFLDIARSDIAKMEQHGEHTHFLRAYAKANEHEFFAVSVEHYFERPDHFFENHPTLFNTMAMMLRIDPRQPNAKVRLNKR